MSDGEHDEFGDRDGLDEQESAIGAEDAQCAFALAPPVKRQYASNEFDQPKIFIRSRCEERCVPPGGDEDHESENERSALECAAAGRSSNKRDVSVHDWSNGSTTPFGSAVAGGVFSLRLLWTRGSSFYVIKARYSEEGFC
jgi:hypothetical protein